MGLEQIKKTGFLPSSAKESITQGGVLVERTAMVDLMENAVYVVKKGKLTKVTAKEFGQDVIVWKNGEVLDVDRSQRMRIDGQEVI